MRILESPLNRECVLDGRTMLCFAGCGYLGLQQEPSIRQAVHAAYEQQGINAGIGRSYDIQGAANAAAEQAGARFFGSETVCTVASGFVTPQIVIHLAAGQVDYIVADELAHLALGDAFLQLGLPVHRFRHRDPDDLDRLVRTHGGRPLVATDGAFATFGWVAPVVAYWQVIAARGGWLLVDEAHSVGCIGPHRRGAYDVAGLTDERVLVAATLSKAFCSFGGIIPLSHAQRGILAKKSPILRGSSESSVPALATTAASFRYLAEHPERYATMDARAAQLRAGFRALGLTVPETSMPIVTIDLGDAARTKAIATGLCERGFLVQHSFYIGAGPNGVLRHTVMASHTAEDIDRLLTAWRNLLGHSERS
ncbi:MAG: pyridoxal phosphate-dependent aminotransferase family protein [Planctomycetota bacterium]